MIRTILSSACLVWAFTAYAQCFTTPFYFEDKDGNRDTLIVGISNDVATCDLQTDTCSEAEAMDAILSGRHWAWFGTFVYHQKPCGPHRVHVIPNSSDLSNILSQADCRMWFPEDRLPVSVSWNSEDFADTARSKSLFSDMNQWFDVAGEGSELYQVFASEVSSIQLFESNHYEVQLLDSTINVKYIGFAFCSEAEWINYNRDPWYWWFKEAVDDIISPLSLNKIMRNGQLYLRCDGIWYNILGQPSTFLVP